MNTCGGCRFWVKHPTNPLAIGQLPLGECRCLPPGQIVLPGQQGLMISNRYPVTPEPFPACGQYHPAEQPTGHLAAASDN